ncbi:hypothetical protein [Massilia sp. TN1-12]|uniref:hypothetical protein n=1 Tax=Massilia paldalensis TaxID=3377675 RepID=UPI00384A6146
MSISRRSVRAHLGAALLLVSGMTSAAEQPASVAPRMATSAQLTAVEKSLAGLLAGREDFADGMSAIAYKQHVAWSSSEGGRLLVPTYVRFKGEKSGYCRLTTLSDDVQSVELISISEEPNAPDCRGFRTLRYLDVNGDGQLDVISSSTIKSNTFDGNIELPVVYVSNGEQPGGYCYSGSASAALAPSDMVSDGKIKAALERHQRRLGLAEFTCDPRP